LYNPQLDAAHYSKHDYVAANILAVAIFLTAKAPKGIWDVDLNLDVNEANLDMFRQGRRTEGKNEMLFCLTPS